MKNLIKSRILYILVLIAFGISASKPKSETPKEKEIKWLTFEQAIKESQKGKRKIVVDVYTDWCGWCKKMDATTFSHPKIVDYINKKYYAVKLDAESMKTFQFKGQTISERELATQVLKVTAYPTTVYLDENFDLISPVPGFWEAKEYDKVIHFFGDDNHKKLSWEDFQKSYVANW